MQRPLELVAVAAVACSALLVSGCAAPAGGEELPGGVETVARQAQGPAAAGGEARTPEGARAADDGPAAGLGPVCTSPAGYSVAQPQGWSVNPGTTLPRCSWFDPEPFSVPEATDVRTAITFRVEAGPAAATWPDERSRTVVEIDGRTAHRIEQVTTAGLYPPGTPITSYAVDLGDGYVLVADTVGLAALDHERNVRVLDAMMRTLELHGGPVV